MARRFNWASALYVQFLEYLLRRMFAFSALRSVQIANRIVVSSSKCAPSMACERSLALLERYSHVVAWTESPVALLSTTSFFASMTEFLQQ